MLEGDSDGMPVLIRFREPLLATTNTQGYEQVLTVLWAYADEGSGALPDEATSAELTSFEDHLCEAFEHDAHAVLAAVVTTDGARQWIIYSDDIDECGQRLTDMPHGDGPYPIEMQTDADPEWSYFRDTVSPSDKEDEAE